jgi:hypothetical protein
LTVIDWTVYLAAYQQRARAFRHSRITGCDFRIEDLAKIADVAKGGMLNLDGNTGTLSLTHALEGGR